MGGGATTTKNHLLRFASSTSHHYLLERANTMSTQQPDSYLKSLSKKQYSWMQKASSPQSDSAGSPEPERSTKASPVDNAANTESVKTTELEAPSNTPSQPNDPMDTSTDVEPDQGAEDHDVEGQTVEDQDDNKASSRKRDIKSKPTNRPRFKYTNFPVKGFNILPTRNITSQYAKNDSLNLQGILAGEKSIQPDVSFSIYHF
jgi:actin-related protein 8